MILTILVNLMIKYFQFEIVLVIYFVMWCYSMMELMNLKELMLITSMSHVNILFVTIITILK